MRFPDCSEVKQLTLIVRRDEVGLSSGSIVSEHHQDGLLAVVMLVALCEPYVAAVVLLTLAGLDRHQQPCTTCLLYTSDAADDTKSVDLGGRRIIKKIFF